MPVSQPSNLGTVDEIGRYTSKPTHKTTNSRSSADEAGGSTARPGAGRRPGSADRNRFTITNAEIPEDPASQRRPSETAAPTKNAATRNKAWPTAEDEKARLYEEARDKVARTQGIAARGASPPVRALCFVGYLLIMRITIARSCYHTSTCSSCSSEPLAHSGGGETAVVQRGSGGGEEDPRIGVLFWSQPKWILSGFDPRAKQFRSCK